MDDPAEEPRTNKATQILYRPFGLISSMAGGVKAAIDRGAARTLKKWTGQWPGEWRPQPVAVPSQVTGSS